ncbi:hypothetical protein IJT93_07750 [bacterium]|nr:hypothetical protein [bacterium]
MISAELNISGTAYPLLSAEISEEVNAGFTFKMEVPGVCPAALKQPFAEFALTVCGVAYAGKVTALDIYEGYFAIEGKDLFSVEAARTYIDAQEIKKTTAAAVLDAVSVSNGSGVGVHFATDEGNQTVFYFVKNFTDMLGCDFRTNPAEYGAEVCIRGAAGLGAVRNLDGKILDYELFKDFTDLYSYVCLCKVCPMDVKKEHHPRLRADLVQHDGGYVLPYLTAACPSEFLQAKASGEIFAHEDAYDREKENFSVQLVGRLKNEEAFSIGGNLNNNLKKADWSNALYIPKAEYIHETRTVQTYTSNPTVEKVTIYHPCHGENPLGAAGSYAYEPDAVHSYHGTTSYLYALGSDNEEAFVSRDVIARKITDQSGYDYYTETTVSNHTAEDIYRNTLCIFYWNYTSTGPITVSGPAVNDDILYCPYGHDYLARRTQTWEVVNASGAQNSSVVWQNIGPEYFPWYHLTRKIKEFQVENINNVDTVTSIKYDEAELNRDFDPLQDTDTEISVVSAGNTQPKGYHIPTRWTLNCQPADTVGGTNLLDVLSEKDSWRTARMVVRKGRSRESKYFDIYQFSELTSADIFIDGEYADEYGVSAQVLGITLDCCPLNYDPSFRIVVEEGGVSSAQKGYCITASFWAHKEEARALGSLYLKRINRNKLSLNLKTVFFNQLRIGDRFYFKDKDFTVLSVKHTISSSKMETQIGACLSA